MSAKTWKTELLQESRNVKKRKVTRCHKMSTGGNNSDHPFWTIMRPSQRSNELALHYFWHFTELSNLA